MVVRQRLQNLDQSLPTLLPTCPSPPPHTHAPAGSIGGTYATPLVNLPEVAIVALGRIQKMPRYDAASGALMPV